QQKITKKFGLPQPARNIVAPSSPSSDWFRPRNAGREASSAKRSKCVDEFQQVVGRFDPREDATEHVELIKGAIRNPFAPVIDDAIAMRIALVGTGQRLPRDQLVPLGISIPFKIDEDVSHVDVSAL